MNTRVSRWRVASLMMLAMVSGIGPPAVGQSGVEDGSTFGYLDVFDLEVAADPQISPDGSRVVYVRRGSDIMTDRARTSLWILNHDGTGHRPLTDGTGNVSQPRWSPDGTRLLYVSSEDGSAQLWIRWMDTGQTAELTNLTESPGGLSWSPDGRWIAMTFAPMPPRPEGAQWAEPPRVISKLRYRADGAGYIEDGTTHIFVLPAEGGTPRQVTSGPFNHGGTPSWTPDSRALVFSANRRESSGSVSTRRPRSMPDPMAVPPGIA